MKIESNQGPEYFWQWSPFLGRVLFTKFCQVYLFVLLYRVFLVPFFYGWQFDNNIFLEHQYLEMKSNQKKATTLNNRVGEFCAYFCWYVDLYQRNGQFLLKSENGSQM